MAKIGVSQQRYCTFGYQTMVMAETLIVVVCEHIEPSDRKQLMAWMALKASHSIAEVAVRASRG